MHRRGSYNATLGALIVLVLATILFGVLAYMRYNDDQVLRKGDAETPQGSTLEDKRLERDQLERSVAALEEEVASLKSELSHADIKLASHRILWDNNTNSWSMGEAGDRSLWVRTRESVENNLKILQIYKAALEAQTDIHRPMEDTIRNYSDQLATILQRLTDVDVVLNEDRQRLQLQYDALVNAERAERETFAITKSELATKKTQYEERIRELLELRLEWLGELQPDARILERELNGDYILIDIGANKRVFNGLRFEVFQYKRGAYVKKAMAEVIDHGANVAQCRLIDEIDPIKNPVTKGDMVANPIFDTEEAKIVVLAGEFMRYNREDLETFLRRSGAEVRKELGPGVDYLIAGGDRSLAAQDEAREYRVTAMREDQLIPFLYTGFRPEE